MPPQGSGDDPRDASVATRVKAGTKTAIVQYAHQLDSEAGPYEDVSQASLVLRWIREGLAREWDDLPEEARDALDDDLQADAGEGGEPA